MEISSTLIERALDGVNELALPVVGASCLYLMLRSGAPALVPAFVARPRRRRSRLVRRGASLLGLLVAVGSPSSAAGRRRPQAPAAAEVRTEPGRFPPPRLPGSAGPAVHDDDRGAPGGEGPPRTPGRRPGSVAPRHAAEDVLDPPWLDDAEPSAHPAVHGGRRSDLRGPLFGRRRPARTVGADARRLASPEHTKWHAVLPGETLWSIAAQCLETDDVRRIARYWPRIHRANRDEIGADPNLIHPGQVLELPPEHA